MTSRNAPIISLVPLDQYDDLLPYFEALQDVLQRMPVATETVTVTTTMSGGSYLKVKSTGLLKDAKIALYKQKQEISSMYPRRRFTIFIQKVINRLCAWGLRYRGMGISMRNR